MRLFVLLENACHELDLTAHMQGIDDCGPSYRRYSALHQLTELKDEQNTLKDGLQLLEQLLTYALVTGVYSASNPVFAQAVVDIQTTNTRLQHLVSNTITAQISDIHFYHVHCLHVANRDSSATGNLEEGVSQGGRAICKRSRSCISLLSCSAASLLLGHFCW